MDLRVVMLGDIVGLPGVNAVKQQLPRIRKKYQPHVVIANAENAHQGTGLTPKLYAQLGDAGINAFTLGDHVYKKSQIVSVLQNNENIVRPANISKQAAGRPWMKLDIAMKDGSTVSLYVCLVLGRILTSMPCNDPFEAVDTLLGQLPQINPILIVEMHAEATSEKRAIGYYLDGQVAAVVGTHTHVVTADEQILPKGTGYITDMGMTGPHSSIIGRAIEPVVKHMTTAMHAPFDVADGDPRVNGVVIDIDTQTRQTKRIQRLCYKADPTQPPFVT